jgi:hypothetical protein
LHKSIDLSDPAARKAWFSCMGGHVDVIFFLVGGFNALRRSMPA